MTADLLIQGSLFAEDFLQHSVKETQEWRELDDNSLATTKQGLQDLFQRFPHQQNPNESQTEDDLIWPVLELLGWSESLRQQNLSSKRREDVPDGILFADSAAKDQANTFKDEWRRYEYGTALVESKRWARPLDRRSERSGEINTPSTQLLRYLRRVDDLTTGELRWGILTNGVNWRLYFAGARSVSEQFFEIDLPTLLGMEGHDLGLFPMDTNARNHWLRIFILIFRKQSFLKSDQDEETFHQKAIEEGRFHQRRVASNLSEVVFERVFPDLAKAISQDQPEASLSDVRDATLVLLYRLLFILYAEDRNLLPVRDDRYDDYALRAKVREDIRRRKEEKDTFSATAARYWSVIDDLCRAIDKGDPSIGLPPYNGGLFDRKQTPLLDKVRLGDEVIATVVDALSFEQTDKGRRYINYRDLGVQQLGSIYERLLEQEVVREDGDICVRLNIFARKGSGSYYTPDELVGLIVEKTLAPLVSRRLEAFRTKLEEPDADEFRGESKTQQLQMLDPAEKLLDLKVCDPAMGSGHFLVNLVDYLTDQVIGAIAEAEAMCEGYVSPLNNRIEEIRNTITGNAEEQDWHVDPSQLDDRHIVRRMVLKRCVYGVDKNPMAVELAKVSLWLHTFTVGAPLSFLDHHLRCVNSLFGAWVQPAIETVRKAGEGMFLEPSLRQAIPSGSAMQIIEAMTDSEIAEAHHSASVFAQVSEMTGPIDAFLSLYHAFAWLNPTYREDQAAYQFFLNGRFGDPVEIAKGGDLEADDTEHGARFRRLLDAAREIISEQRFLNWQIAFPGVWSQWEAQGLLGGFDAVIGNPPWERMKLQQVEWFLAR